MLFACILFASSCSRPTLSETDESVNGAPVEESGIAFRMENAAFWTNGTLRSDRVSLETSDFVILFVFLPESGLYLVTLDQTDGSDLGGQFVGSELLFTAGRTEIRFRSDGGPLFGDGIDRDAWVEFIPGFDAGEAGAGVGGPIVGLARLRSQIRGL